MEASTRAECLRGAVKCSVPEPELKACKSDRLGLVSGLLVPALLPEAAAADCASVDVTFRLWISDGPAVSLIGVASHSVVSES